MFTFRLYFAAFKFKKAFKSNSLTRTQLIEYCILWCPDYLLENQEKGPVHGILHQNGILELMLYCQKKEKWNYIPYIVPQEEKIQITKVKHRETHWGAETIRDN